jgi:hypothetical protein
VAPFLYAEGARLPDRQQVRRQLQRSQGASLLCRFDAQARRLARGRKDQHFARLDFTRQLKRRERLRGARFF